MGLMSHHYLFIASGVDIRHTHAHTHTHTHTNTHRHINTSWTKSISTNHGVPAKGWHRHGLIISTYSVIN